MTNYMTYIHFTEEQKYRASCVDLVEFLRRQGEKLIRSGPEYRMASDRSVTVRSNEWYDHASKEGGGPISFVQNYFGLSYPEAVTRLLDGEQGRIYEPASRKKEEPKKEPTKEPEKQPEQKPEETKPSKPSVSGAAVANYAMKFIGGKYVWGGANLATGVDCSGFVMCVYQHFGYSLPHYSESLAGCGRGVSYANAQPGDIICYRGHCGIYIGGGMMVNALGAKYGIVVNQVNTSRLTAVRRIV